MKKMIPLVFSILLLLAACQANPSAGSDKTMEGSAGTNSGDMATDDMAADSTKTEEAGVYHKITAEEAKTMMDEQTVTVVDVRTEAEYQEGHIADAVLVPNESIADQMPEALPDKEATLLVYCRSGRRSKEASEKLLELGYRNVYDFGGINDWPYDVVKD